MVNGFDFTSDVPVTIARGCVYVPRHRLLILNVALGGLDFGAIPECLNAGLNLAGFLYLRLRGRHPGLQVNTFTIVYCDRDDWADKLSWHGSLNLPEAGAA